MTEKGGPQPERALTHRLAFFCTVGRVRASTLSTLGGARPSSIPLYSKPLSCQHLPCSQIQPYPLQGVVSPRAFREWRKQRLNP